MTIFNTNTELYNFVVCGLQLMMRLILNEMNEMNGKKDKSQMLSIGRSALALSWFECLF
jgi:hypothetical protein